MEKKSPNRVAFGGFLDPSTNSIEEVLNITEEEINWMTPVNLNRFLYVDKISKKDKDLSVNGLNLNSFEFQLIVKSPKALADRAKASALKEEINEENIEKADRARKHALNNKIEAMKNHAEKIEKSLELLYRLRNEARSPGYAHYKEERFIEMMANFWREVDNILDVLMIVRQWDDDQRQRAREAISIRLNSQAQNIRVAKWQNMIDCVIDYTHNRLILFNLKIHESESLIEN